MRSVNSARDPRKAVVFTLAMLLAITETFISCAAMPVAAIESTLISNPSDRHAAQFLISGNDLVANGNRRLQRGLRVHDRLDDLLHRGLALHAADRCRLGALELADPVLGDLHHDGAEIGGPGGAADGDGG